MPVNYGLLTKAGAPTSGVDEVETLAVDATGGTFTLTFGGEETDPLAFDATAEEIQAALEALSTVGPGGVTVAGDGPYTITFSGALSGLPQTDITADSSALTGGAHTASVTEATAGVRGDYRGAPARQSLIDTTNRRIYENTGTPARPAWTEVSVV